MTTVHGVPPWDGSPTPPLNVFEVELERDPELTRKLSRGHLANLLGMALDERTRFLHAATDLASQLAELHAVEERDSERRRVKREYMQRFRAARAAQRAGVR